MTGLAAGLPMGPPSQGTGSLSIVMDANQLRRAFTGFFAERGHTVVPSASLIPHDPDLLFTVAGMVPFKPYFLGEEPAPWPRATTVQKCVRAGGKDSDLEEVGRDGSHLSFFEMLGNFSFGDYFKSEAIPMAWELVTEVFGLDPEQLWVTVHTSDDEAAEIWREAVGVRPDRIQRLGADNWWGPPGGPPGPCGPCSEIYVDLGERHGAGGGPAEGAEARFLEIWNLVFMQFNRDTDGVDAELPRKNIDTGAGLERVLGVLQGKDSVWEIDVLAPLVDAAQSVTGVLLGRSDAHDVSLRILAEHARTMTFLISDGVFPTNEKRGYVLRRIIRRAVRHAWLLGVEQLVTPDLVDTTVAVMGEAYPDIVRNHDFVRDVVSREEDSFRRTLATGSQLLAVELEALAARGGSEISGEVAFTLHDTHGFPLELTEEIASEHGVGVDGDGFAREMAAQRARAKEAARTEGVDEAAYEAFHEVLDEFGPTEFTGRAEESSTARLLALVGDVAVLDRTPFYAESGGQVGDTGFLVSDTGRAEVLDTTAVLPGLSGHRIAVTDGTLQPGQQVTATIDGARRAAIRRNHTATHLLHWALREVLGDHVKQQGSLVAPDRLRFDFSHYQALTPDETARVEDLVNADVLANHPARHYETTMDEARGAGAIAFFGDKYGDIVRVLEAGPHSIELCGGTHVRALGDIGPVKIIREESIGSNIRRIEAVTGFGTIERLRAEEARVAEVAERLGVPPDDLAGAVDKRLSEIKSLRDEVKRLRREARAGRTADLAAAATGGVVVARVDELPRDELRELALAVRDRPGVRAVVLAGAAEGGGVALVSAVQPGDELHAHELVADALRLIKGGGGKNAELVTAGGKDVAAIDEALAQVRAVAGIA